MVSRLVSEHKAAHPFRIPAAASTAGGGGREDSQLSQLLGRILQEVMQEAGQLLAASLTPQVCVWGGGMCVCVSKQMSVCVCVCVRKGEGEIERD